MTASVLAYCLEQATDHGDFERFATALMEVDGYAGIEPLGGSTDHGRDAVLTGYRHGTNVIFAYSLRADWKTKLNQDVNSVREHQHPCSEFVFVTSEKVTTPQRDELRKKHQESYGWELTLYAQERIVHLLSQHPHLIHRFPTLFPPATVAALRQSHPDRQTVVILAAQSDKVFANWLYDRLNLLGFRVWSNLRNLLPGFSTKSLQELIQSQARCVLQVCPAQPYQDQLLTELCQDVESLARRENCPTIFPILTAQSDRSLQSRFVGELTGIDFTSWARGLEKIDESLGQFSLVRGTTNSPLTVMTTRSAEFVRTEPEQLVSNAFQILRIPDKLRVYHLGKSFRTGERRTVADEWAFRLVGDRCVSFTIPPDHHRRPFDLEIDGEFDWMSEDQFQQIPCRHIVSELIRKELLCLMIRAGLRYGAPGPPRRRCDQFKRGPLHFPDGLLEDNSVQVHLPRVTKPQEVYVIGQGHIQLKVPFRYHLAPRFTIVDGTIEPGEFTLLAYPQFYITDLKGTPLSCKRAHQKRRALAKGIRNKRHRNLVLATMEFLGNGENLLLGESECPLVISRQPMVFDSPIRLVPPPPKTSHSST